MINLETTGPFFLPHDYCDLGDKYYEIHVHYMIMLYTGIYSCKKWTIPHCSVSGQLPVLSKFLQGIL